MGDGRRVGMRKPTAFPSASSVFTLYPQPSAPTALCLLHWHAPGPGLLLLWRREAYLEHAIVEGRVDLIGVDALWQRNGAIEHSVRALGAKEPVMFLLLVLLPMFAGDREYAIVDLDANLILLSLRDVGTDDELVTAPKRLE